MGQEIASGLDAKITALKALTNSAQNYITKLEEILTDLQSANNQLGSAALLDASSNSGSIPALTTATGQRLRTAFVDRTNESVTEINNNRINRNALQLLYVYNTSFNTLGNSITIPGSESNTQILGWDVYIKHNTNNIVSSTENLYYVDPLGAVSNAVRVTVDGDSPLTIRTWVASQVSRTFEFRSNRIYLKDQLTKTNYTFWLHVYGRKW